MLRKRASALSYEPNLEQPVFEGLYHEAQREAEGLLISKRVFSYDPSGVVQR
ncbi:MAG: hypothetical protein BWY82_00870 [Verrucomicrobia bacterium ADurb.Bin474]|nr:MAG: hypothetical protein BWY82_00870 [Verrucomicrobia bacterium ADurb.Bin474]